MFTNQMNSSRLMSFTSILRQHPNAESGSDKYPKLKGITRFYQTKYKVLVFAEIFGLPTPETPCKNHPIFAFHIHMGNNCSGTNEGPFAEVMLHYDKYNCEHPYHAGDMPPLFGGTSGYAFQVFLTDRFSVCDILGKTVIIHSNPDDFTTQPSGNAVSKIACGQIKS